MNDVRVFSTSGSQGKPVPHRRFPSETALCRFIVRHAVLLDLTVLATEYSITTNGEGRIDALGLDLTGNPIIIEFKREANGTAICQGRYYLDWLVHHRERFAMLVKEQLGA